MSFQEEERQDKKLKAFLMWVGLAIRDGRAAGFTDAQVVKTLQNQIGAGDVAKLQGAREQAAEPGGVTARARERGLSTGDFGEWKRARAAVGLAPGGDTIEAVGSLLPGRKGWTVDVDGKPVKSEMQAWARHISETVSELTRFQRLLVKGLIPPEEVEAARVGGVAAWRRLRAKYGSENPPVPDPGFGAGGAA